MCAAVHLLHTAIMFFLHDDFILTRKVSIILHYSLRSNVSSTQKYTKVFLHKIYTSFAFALLSDVLPKALKNDRRCITSNLYSISQLLSADVKLSSPIASILPIPKSRFRQHHSTIKQNPKLQTPNNNIPVNPPNPKTLKIQVQTICKYFFTSSTNSPFVIGTPITLL